MISFTFIVSQVVLYNVSSVQMLWAASALLGLGYGGMFGLFPTIIIEWFGLGKQFRGQFSSTRFNYEIGHFSQNWGFLCLSPVIAGNLFSLAFGRNLDAHSRPLEDVTEQEQWRRGGLPPVDSGRQCLTGRLCYVDSVKLTIVACIVGFILSVVGALQDRRKRELTIPRREVVIWETNEET